MNAEDDILIVDDGTQNLKLLTGVLEREGYRVRPAETAQAAIDSALPRPPMLILLDIKLPDMDGFGVCRRLKQDERTRDVPIIFIGALLDTEDRVQGFKVGGVGIISKPLQEQEILAQVETHSHVRRMQLQLEKLVAERTAQLEAIIVEHEKTVKVLATSEERFRGLMEQSPSPIEILSPEGNIEHVNFAWRQLWGLNKEQAAQVMEQYNILTTPQTADLGVAPLIRNVFEGDPEVLPPIQYTGNQIAVDLGFPHKNLGAPWIQRHLYPVKNRQGKVVFVVNTYIDVTNQKEAEERLSRAERRYRTVADFAYDWEWWLDQHDRYVYVSPSCERISGYTPEEFVGDTDLIDNIILAEDRNVWKEHNEKAKSKDGLWLSQFRIRRKDGIVRWIEHASRPVRDNEGKHLGFRASNRDITERKEAEEEARQLADALAHSQRVANMGELSASLAHELCQPLAAILSNAQAARRVLQSESPDLDLVHDVLNDVIADDKRAGEVIRRLRSVMRKEKGPEKLIVLNETIRQVIRLVHGEIVAKRIDCATELAEGLPEVLGNVVELQQVLLNLIMNATQAMEGAPAGRKRIVIRTEQENGNVSLLVSDSGCGIPEGDLERIFDAFYTTKREGMGMGLAICRTIVESLGGSLRAQNKPEGGAQFCITIPAADGRTCEDKGVSPKRR